MFPSATSIGLAALPARLVPVESHVRPLLPGASSNVASTASRQGWQPSVERLRLRAFNRRLQPSVDKSMLYGG